MTYFNRVNRNQVLYNIDEAKGERAPALEKLKNADLTSRAESLLAGWLSVPLRIAANDEAPESEVLAIAAAE